MKKYTYTIQFQLTQQTLDATEAFRVIPGVYSYMDNESQIILRSYKVGRHC